MEMQSLPLKPERLAALEKYARLHDQTPAEALDELLGGVLPAEQDYQELSPEQWVCEFRAWSQSHADLDLPILSDEAISRESIYEDRGL